MEQLLKQLAELPPLVFYAVIGIGAAIENVVPPVPADTFVLFGSFVAATGGANAWAVFIVTWVLNVGTALLVYALAFRHGKRVFSSRFGRMLLNEQQLKKVGGFYEKWGIPAIFFSRFLPAFRAIVPVFGGVSKVPFWKLAPPLALASGLWYGALIYLGTAAGRNFDQVKQTFERYNRILLIAGSILVVAFVVWWVKSRREGHSKD